MSNFYDCPRIVFSTDVELSLNKIVGNLPDRRRGHGLRRHRVAGALNFLITHAIVPANFIGGTIMRELQASTPECRTCCRSFTR